MTEFASLAKFIAANGSISNAVVALERRGTRENNLSPKLADIIKAGHSMGLAGKFKEQRPRKPPAAFQVRCLRTIPPSATGLSVAYKIFPPWDGMLSSCVSVSFDYWKRRRNECRCDGIFRFRRQCEIYFPAHYYRPTAEPAQIHSIIV